MSTSGEVDRQAAGAGGGVDEDQRAVVGTRGPHDRRHDGGRGLVVRPGVDVDAGLGNGVGKAARVGLDDRRGVEPRRLLGGLGELRRELAEAEVLALLLDEAERRDVPERGGATVAQHDLVALGQVEQSREPLAHPADDVPHRGLAVGRAHQAGTGRGERVEVAGLDLRRAGTEAAVGGLELCGDLQR